MTTYADLTIAEIIHDYTLRANLDDHDARDQLAAVLERRMASAWDEGHRTYRKLGPDGCMCGAWSDSECGCGLYGSNVITPNPYRTTETREA